MPERDDQPPKEDWPLDIIDMLAERFPKSILLQGRRPLDIVDRLVQ